MIKNKDTFNFVGKSIFIEGNSIHELHYTEQKTAFYKELFAEGFLKNLMPHSVDKKGYALITPTNSGIKYYAGVITDENLPEYDSLSIPKENYHVSQATSGLSRLLFDQLENTYFIDQQTDETTYNGGIVLEVLLNGNPMDAEVELWVSVK